jgi:hypothetical protein
MQLTLPGRAFLGIHQRHDHLIPANLRQKSRHIFTKSVTSTDQMINLHSMLSSFVCPDSLLEAGYTPLGRGLVARSPAAAGTPLLSVAWPNLLCVTDEIGKDGSDFSSRVLEDGQLLHGALPSPLVEFLQRSDVTWSSRLAAWLLWLRKSSGSGNAGMWSLYTELLPLVRNKLVINGNEINKLH